MEAGTDPERMDDRIRLLLVGPDARIRRVLAMRLASEPDLVVVGEAGDVPGARAAASELQPAVIVVDLGARDARGCVDLEPVRQLAPLHRVVALAIDDSRCLLDEAREAGAAALVAKQGDPDELLAVIRRVAGAGVAEANP